MAWGNPGSIGASGNETSGTSYAHTCTSAVPTYASNGTMLFVQVATDNVATNTGFTSLHSSVTDSGGNTYIKIVEYTVALSAAADGATVSVWATMPTVALTTSSTVTATFGAAVVAKVVGGVKKTVAAGKQWKLVARKVGTAVANTVQPALTFSGLPSAEHFILQVNAIESAGNFTADTADGYAIVHNTASGSGGAADTHLRLASQFFVGTTTGQTVDGVFSAAGDWASVLLVFDEVDPQMLRPISTQTAGGWTDSGGGTTNIYTNIDDTTGGSGADTDYIKSALGSSSDTCKFKLTSAVLPRTGTATMRYRYDKAPSGGATENINVALMQGGTIIDTNSHTGIASGFIDGSFTLDLTGITDWTDLYVAFEAVQV